MIKIMKEKAKLVKITNNNEDLIKEYEYNFSINEFTLNSYKLEIRHNLESLEILISKDPG